MKFRIISPFYNVEEWLKATINSVKRQTVQNWEYYLIDDLSTDNSLSIALRESSLDSRIHVITNTTKKLALGNILYCVDKFNFDDEDIIVILDGDDWFSRVDALQIVLDAYQNNHCWLTYGSYIEYPSGIRGKFAAKLPDEIIENASYRTYPWSTSALRTFKTWLFKSIDRDDLREIETGCYYRVSDDLAIMFPMLEMAGPRSFYINEVIYVYNRSNALNNDKIANPLQLKLEKEIRERRKYKLVER